MLGALLHIIGLAETIEPPTDASDYTGQYNYKQVQRMKEAAEEAVQKALEPARMNAERLVGIMAEVSGAEYYRAAKDWIKKEEEAAAPVLEIEPWMQQQRRAG